MPERLVRHYRPKVRPADADIDHVADAFAGLAFPGAAAHADRKVRHSFQNGVNVGNHVAAIMKDRGAARRSQCDMQHRPVFRDVDLVTAEHGVDTVAQPQLVRELQQ